ncbi:hypothetical protein PUN28_000668 [Cardiocondyla obscurior]|uniref:Secreted protein n=1 Tax=Cardiocondyla obscurior TaxID=286306 RepID=A0AAW2H0H1_9HYME
MTLRLLRQPRFTAVLLLVARFLRRQRKGGRIRARWENILLCHVRRRTRDILDSICGRANLHRSTRHARFYITNVRTRGAYVATGRTVVNRPRICQIILAIETLTFVEVKCRM